MGCDFFYSGTLPDQELQKKVVELAQSYFDDDALIVHPTPGREYPTLDDRGDETEVDIPAYPFNYYGILPHREGWPVERGQFVFDRTHGGRLVSILRFPSFMDNLSADVRSGPDEPVQIRIKEGGYIRLIETASSFALLLNLIRIRWWPDISVGDDYNIFKEIGHLIWQYRLMDKLRNETLDFPQCFDLYIAAYEARNPPPPPRPSRPPKPRIKVVNLKMLDEPISIFEFPIRTSTCLSELGIKTIRQLLDHTVQDLLRHRNMGRKSIFDIQNALQEFGLCLLEESHEEE